MIASPPVGGGFFFSSLDIEILAKLKPQKNSKNSQSKPFKKKTKKKISISLSKNGQISPEKKTLYS
jgi:hypothetical protein